MMTPLPKDPTDLLMNSEKLAIATKPYDLDPITDWGKGQNINKNKGTHVVFNKTKRMYVFAESLIVKYENEMPGQGSKLAATPDQKQKALKTKPKVAKSEYQAISVVGLRH